MPYCLNSAVSIILILEMSCLVSFLEIYKEEATIDEFYIRYREEEAAQLLKGRMLDHLLQYRSLNLNARTEGSLSLAVSRFAPVGRTKGHAVCRWECN